VFVSPTASQRPTMLRFIKNIKIEVYPLHKAAPVTLEFLNRVQAESSLKSNPKCQIDYQVNNSGAKPNINIEFGKLSVAFLE
jgi:hypothetical protein